MNERRYHLFVSSQKPESGTAIEAVERGDGLWLALLLADVIEDGLLVTLAEGKTFLSEGLASGKLEEHFFGFAWIEF